jgi:hypothetical protein
MSDNVNPYQSPQNPVSPAAEASDRLTETMIRYLKEASPWLRFVGIVGFIGCGSLVLLGLIFLFLFSAAGFLWESVPGLEDLSGALGAASGIVLAIYFFIIALLCFFPSLFQYNFGTKIRNYLRTNSGQDLETAFKNNKSLWKFNGILLIISLAFIPITMVIGIIVGIAAAFA